MIFNMPVYHLQLPDRSDYNEIIFQSNQNFEGFLKKINTYKSGLRILLNTVDLTYIQRVLIANEISSQVRKTTWFELEINTINQFLITNRHLKIDNKETYTKKITDKNQKEFAELENFMIHSFGVDFKKDLDGKITSIENKAKVESIVSNLTKSLENVLNSVYIVYCGGAPLGTFTLVHMSDNSEIQVHSVAAKSTLKNRYSGADRLSILLRAMLFKVKENYSFYDKLTFSSSKLPVIEKYLQSGFTANQDRVCIEIL